MGTHYKIRKFAELAGVTVKALHHYDRLGLLHPSRTDAGYRVYGERDLQTLEQIVALKFLGLPLKEIRAVLQRPPLKWKDTLQMQRQALEERQEHLGRAIRAIRAAEAAIDSGRSADLASLKNIIEAIDMQNGIAAMKKYYSEESWEQHRRYYEEGPSSEWQDLYRDASALLDEDPACEKAQALVKRWYDLARRAHNGDPEVQTDSAAAWMDRANWPEAMKQRAAALKMAEVVAYLHRAELAGRKNFFSDTLWAKLEVLQTRAVDEHSAQWRDKVELFRDLEAALGEDPAGEKAQALVARWRAQLDRTVGGDPEVRAAMLTGWSNRRYWPESHHWRIERLHMMSYERFERAADFLDLAIAASEGEKVVKTAEEPKATLKSRLVDEFDEEMIVTRQVLARVPDGQFEWRPHPKSMTLGRLASHVAALPEITVMVLKRAGAKPADVADQASLLAAFDRNVIRCRAELMGLSDERLEGKMLVNPGVERPVWTVLQSKVLINHLVHHRGQLTVYLRLLDVPIPGMYGPSADEKS